MASGKCPFTAATQLYPYPNSGSGSPRVPSNSLGDALPGHPLIRLDDPDPSRLVAFLESEFCCADLETMAPHLWMLSSQSSANIRPLHRQRVIGRDVIITESPRLHLVWYYERIFIKPLPAYLLSYAFWSTYLAPTALSSSRPPPLETAVAEPIRRAALGYIRTYRYLIRHESDFTIAQSIGLVPEPVTWPAFCAFISAFDSAISDDDVSSRYHYGELRLTRLNFYAMFILSQRDYEHIPTQYAAYFARYFGTLLFVFAVLSCVLGAAQLVVSVRGLECAERTSQGTTAALGGVWDAYRWLGIIVVLAGIIVTLLLAGYALYMYFDEWVFAIKVRWAKRRQRLPAP
ncbi:hypothetical protein QBC43DRAFT_363006 [Cladorrhinum sp. PSN259]|nr:hypothetical protein QBC43DRAFT_363006 [Cladorrhinum sp. PSN259]